MQNRKRRAHYVHTRLKRRTANCHHHHHIPSNLPPPPHPIQSTTTYPPLTHARSDTTHQHNTVSPWPSSQRGLLREQTAVPMSRIVISISLSCSSCLCVTLGGRFLSRWAVLSLSLSGAVTPPCSSRDYCPTLTKVLITVLSRVGRGSGQCFLV